MTPRETQANATRTPEEQLWHAVWHALGFDNGRADPKISIKV
jgi:hypothetical protein